MGKGATRLTECLAISRQHPFDRLGSSKIRRPISLSLLRILLDTQPTSNIENIGQGARGLCLGDPTTRKRRSERRDSGFTYDNETCQSVQLRLDELLLGPSQEALERSPLCGGGGL